MMQSNTVTVTGGVAPDVDQIGTWLPLPGLGILPVNAFVVHARAPMLIDTGVVALAGETLAAIRATIDPASLRYIYLTHTDRDHIGCLKDLLELAPKARLVTTYLGMGKLSLTRPIAPERILLLNPGQHLDLGDRRLLVGRPLTYDAPETTWLHEPEANVLFSSDCFGALLPRRYDSAREIPEAELEQGVVAWAGIDSPWFSSLDQRKLRSRLESTSVASGTVLSAHLPPAYAMGETLLGHLARAGELEPAPAPDQAAFEALLASA